MFSIYNLYLPQAGFRYFSLDGAIYDTSGQLLFKPKDAYLCAYHDNGSVVEGNPMRGTLSMYDKNNQLLWSSQENVHHMINFTRDMQKIMLITSEIIPLSKQPVRSDCFSIRDLKNTKIHEWCVGAHLEELLILGYGDQGLWDVGVNSFYKNESAPKEVSHANSFYEIPKNALSATNPAFAEGNFIVHLYGPLKMLMILDPSLQKILWHKKMDRFNFDGTTYVVHSHDNQITPEGNLLSYFSTIENGANTKPHSRLMEINLLTNEVIWQYKRNPSENFHSPISGNLTLLKNGNFLFNDGISAYEITRSGKVVWKFKNPAISAGFPVKIMTVKPFFNTAFLKSRDLD